MRYATFNVLADAYTDYGDYSHADPELMRPGARLKHIVATINRTTAEVVGLQEADQALVEAFRCDDNWQTFWTPKGRDKPDGCLTLVRSDLEVVEHESHTYDDESGHIFQITCIGKLAVANTHIKWSPADRVDHVGVAQARQLLDTIDDRGAAVILADCNDRPGGPVRAMVERAGFANLSGYRPTAIVNGELVAIDLLAVRGIEGALVSSDYDLRSIPNEACASDHIPVVADLEDEQFSIGYN